MNKKNKHFLIKLTVFLVFFFTIFSAFPKVTRAEYVAAVITATVKSTEIKVIIEPTWVNKLIPVSKKATIILSGEGGYIIKETINRNIKDGTKQEFVTFGGLAPNTKYQIETKLEQVVRDAKAENMQTFVSGAASPEIFKIKTLEKEKDRGFFMPVEPGGKQLILDKSASEVKEVETQKEKEASKGEYNLLAPIGGMTEAPTDVGDYFNKIFLIAIGLCGALAVVMLIIGGIQYMGQESVFGKADAKKQMLGALGGLGIALAAYALLNTINPDLLGKGGINIKNLSVHIVPLYDRGYNDPKKANGESVRCTPVASGPCSVANLTPVFGAENAVAMSKICNMESSGVGQASGTDICKPDGKAFSFGLFQVNLLANGSLAGKGCDNLFTPTTGPKMIIPGDANSKFNCNLNAGKEALYNKCKEILLDSKKNIEIAKYLFFESGGKQNWVGDKKFCASAFE